MDKSKWSCWICGSHQWISIKEELPQDKQQVFIYVPDNNTFGYNEERIVVEKAIFIKGKIPNEGDIICPEDQHGNNLVPYKWESGGPKSWFGQEVTHWMAIRIPECD